MKSTAERTFASIVASYLEAHEPEPLETGMPTLHYFDLVDIPEPEPMPILDASKENFFAFRV